MSIDIDPEAASTLGLVRDDEFDDRFPHMPLLQQTPFITSDSGQYSAHIFSLGCSIYNEQLRERFEECIRASVETCDHFDGFIVNHSIQGGTGSSVTSKILQQFKSDFSKSSVICASILSASSYGLVSGSAMSHGCAAMNAYNLVDHCDFSLVMDNQHLVRLTPLSFCNWHVHRIIGAVQSKIYNIFVDMSLVVSYRKLSWNFQESVR